METTTRTKMTSKLFLGEGFLTLHDMKANGFDAHTANAVENLTRQKLYAKYGDQSPSPEIHAGFRWIAARELGIITEGKTKTRLDPKCWKGYKKQGTKMKGGVRVNNCVPESYELLDTKTGEIKKVKDKADAVKLARNKRFKIKGQLWEAPKMIEDWGNDHEDGATAEEVGGAIAHRFMNNTDLMRQALEKAGGPEGLMNAIDSVAQFHAGAGELGSSDISIMVREVLHDLGLKERSLASLRNRASFDGRDKLNKLAAKPKADNKKEKEEELSEVSGDFAEPIYDLIAELGDDDKAHANVLHDLIRYLDGDTIKDFVEEFRRVNDYGNGLEYESVEKADVANGYKPKKKTDERKLTGGEKRSKEANFKKLKKHKGDFEKRYGKDAESVMHAVATKRAKGESIEEALKRDPKLPNLKVSDGKTDYEKKKYASVTAKKNESTKDVKMVGMESIIREYTEAGYFTK